jgi:hypothetical protein
LYGFHAQPPFGLMDNMKFKPLEPSDYPKLKHFFEKQPYRLSIYSLLSLIVWSNCLYRTHYALDGNALIISNESPANPDDRYLILPLSNSERFTPERLYDLAIDLGFRSYRFVSGDYLETESTRKAEPWFEITEQPDYEDYVYLTDDLARLRGNRYARKRNLIHQFSRDYLLPGRVEVTALSADGAGECLAFLERWCEQRNCDVGSDENLACEKQAVILALRHLDVMEGRGIVVRIDGAVSAFAIASRLNEEMGVLNFEKAFSDIRGLYQFLDNECAKRLFAGCRWINKESDMNVSELAQSKRSYHPVMRVKSYRLDLR